MATRPESSLKQRKSPVQARSQQRVQQILTATRSLLREEGLTSVTTTAIAARTGIPVSSVYQYYPNKKAIMLALYEDYLVKVRETFAKFDKPEYLSLGWESFIHKLYGAIFRAEIRDEIENELEKAMSIYPELAELDRQHREKFAEQLVVFLRQLGSRWSKAKLRRLALYTYAIHSGVWDYRAEIKPPAKELLDWNLRLSKSMLGQCFD